MIRLLHFSDPHFGAENPAVARAFQDHLIHHPYDFRVLSGDLTMRARQVELANAHKFISAIPAPLLVIPGNHDIPALNQPFDRFFRPFHRYQKWFGNNLEPSLQAENLHIVSLNSSRPYGMHADWSNGFLSQDQLHRMVEEFQADHGSTRFRILVIHHPLLAVAGRTRAVVNPLPDLLDAISAAQVDLVLCGHFHRSQLATAGTLERWKCVVSQAPTVCSVRLQGEPPGFHEIQLSPQGMEITLWQYHREGFAPSLSHSFGKEENGWNDSGNEKTEEMVSIP